MEKMTSEKVYDEIKKYNLISKEINDPENPEQRKQAFILLSCYEHYLLENFSNMNTKDYMKFYNSWKELNKQYNELSHRLLWKKSGFFNKVKAEKVREEWEKYCLIYEKNNRDISSAEVMEQGFKTLCILYNYKNDFSGDKHFKGYKNSINQLIDQAVKIRDINKNKIIDTTETYLSRNNKYYKVCMQFNCPSDASKIEYAYDQRYSKYPKTARVGVYAVYDGKNLKEIISKKTLLKYPEKYEKLDFQKNVYYSNLIECTEEEVANNLESLLKGVHLNYYYVDALEKQVKNYIWSYDYDHEKKCEEERKREEKEKNTQSNVKALHLYKKY